MTWNHRIFHYITDMLVPVLFFVIMPLLVGIAAWPIWLGMILYPFHGAFIILIGLVTLINISFLARIFSD